MGIVTISYLLHLSQDYARLNGLCFSYLIVLKGFTFYGLRSVA